MGWAAVLTLIALPTLWVVSRDAPSAPGVATAGVDVGNGTEAAAPQTTLDPLAPAQPAFLEPTGSTTASSVLPVAVQAAPSGPVARGEATFRNEIFGRSSCLIADIDFLQFVGRAVTIVNLDNGRSIRCIPEIIPEQPSGVTAVLGTDAFLELADLTDAPIPVEIRG
jgi:hypothetical protein